MSRIVYVTTSIPYVNARPHVGFALELVQADVLARYHRLRGHDVRLQTGTDENALKNLLAAKVAGVDPHELVSSNAEKFRVLGGALNISVDDFIRTTEPRHHQGVDWFWRRLKSGDLYWQSYRGLYCVGCEDFLREAELIDGYCADHRSAPAVTEEKNLFFRLSAYQAQLETLISEGRLRILPESRKAEVLAFIRRGLHDFSVSRSAERYGHWGIRVPGEPSQVIYVWIDALINYVSALGYGQGAADEQRFWASDSVKTHVIGRNVWKFHAIYWPALLLSAGLPLPNELLVHGFLTQDGQKISKSGPTTIDPVSVAQRIGVDGLRYALLASSPPGADADFSLARVEAKYTADLANGLGNLVSRLTGLAQKAGLTSLGHGPIVESPKGYDDAIASFRFDAALALIFERVGALNLAITEARPWDSLRSLDSAVRTQTLPSWLHELRAIGQWLAPFLPDTSARIDRGLTASPLKLEPPLFPRLLVTTPGAGDAGNGRPVKA